MGVTARVVVAEQRALDGLHAVLALAVEEAVDDRLLGGVQAGVERALHDGPRVNDGNIIPERQEPAPSDTRFRLLKGHPWRDDRHELGVGEAPEELVLLLWRENPVAIGVECVKDLPEVGVCSLREADFRMHGVGLVRDDGEVERLAVPKGRQYLVVRVLKTGGEIVDA